MSQMPSEAYSYEVPSVIPLLSLSSFIFLLNVADRVFTQWLHAGLLGPLILGTIFGPQLFDIIPHFAQTALIYLGYIGLLLIVFQGGLSSDFGLVWRTVSLSLFVATTGVVVPIGLSLFLLHFAYSYSWLQSFAAGAALCSTSLGTVLALLDSRIKQSRVGVVLVSAALLDDIAGLVMASIISELASRDTASGVPWQTIVRPVLVSLSFAIVAPLAAFALSTCLGYFPRMRAISTPTAQIWILVTTLCGFVAGARYAGTSDVFGAYFAGAFLAQAFKGIQAHKFPEVPSESPPLAAFNDCINPLLVSLFLPLFFASIGAALPIRSLGSVRGSRTVVWRGLVYALLMTAAKAVTGLWMFAWPERRLSDADAGGAGEIPLPVSPTQVTEPAPVQIGRPPSVVVCAAAAAHASTSTPVPARSPHPSPPFSRAQQALLLGLAMVARGEIALIVAQLGKPLIGGMPAGAEAFAVVIWAILVTTIVGAAGVGLYLRSLGLGRHEQV
jgi:Kef-type K+ transport system membrane component KefB